VLAACQARAALAMTDRLTPLDATFLEPLGPLMRTTAFAAKCERAADAGREGSGAAVRLIG